MLEQDRRETTKQGLLKSGFMIWFRFLLHRNPTDKAHWFVMSPFCRPILDDPEIVNTLPPIPLAKIPPTNLKSEEE